MGPAAAQIFETIYRDHAAACRRYAAALPGDADDVVHDVFVKLVRHLAGGGTVETPRAWLLSAVRSTALDHRRSQRRRRHRESHIAGRIGMPDTPPEQPEIEHALLQLDSAEREAVILHLWCDAKFTEVATLLGVATSTAHATYRRGLDKLRPLLAEDSP